MENAVKALLIAAGMFIAVLLISLIAIFYNNVTGYYASQHENKQLEQVTEFNAKFENYNRKNVRGSDLISLMNRVIDYNASESYGDDKSYEKIKVTITLGGEDIRSQFKYETNDPTSVNKYLNAETITNTKNNGDKWQNDRDLIAITNTSIDLSDDLQSYDISNITDTQLQQLSTGIVDIMAHEDRMTSSDAFNRFKRAQIIEDVLGIKVYTTADENIPASCKIKIDKDSGKTLKGQGIIEDIKNMVSQYYQYMQFKRAYFDCEETIYDTRTNRIVEIKFKLQVNDDDKVVFD